MYQKEKAPYEERYSRVMKYFGVFLAIALIGSITIIGFLPEEVSCALERNYWFTVLWPPNLVNKTILQVNHGNLDICRVIPATSWSAAMGILMFLDRVIFEYFYNERREIIGVKGPIILLIIAISLILPQNPLNPTVIVHTKSFFSINTNSFSFISEIKLIFFAFIAFFFAAEGGSYILIHLRATHDEKIKK
jgi:hypothetical protein